jgi:subtilisin-like proprotein convertase family protein
MNQRSSGLVLGANGAMVYRTDGSSDPARQALGWLRRRFIGGSGGGRTAKSRPAVRRSAVTRAVEGLEQRWMMAGDTFTVEKNNQFFATGNFVTYSSPKVAVNPLNQFDLVAVAIARPTTPQIPFEVAVYQYSNDGGNSWKSGGVIGTLADPQGGTFTVVSDVSVGFDRGNNFYVSSLQQNTNGVTGGLALSKFTFGGTGAPVSVFNGQPVRTWGYVGANVPGPTDTSGQIGIVTPVMAVSQNVASFTEGVTTFTDANVTNGNWPVYIAYSTVRSNTQTTSANQLRLLTSLDGGATFTSSNVEDAGFGNTAYQPAITISQGNLAKGINPGTVNVLWTVTSNSNQSFPTDVIRSRTFTGAGVASGAAKFVVGTNMKAGTGGGTFLTTLDSAYGNAGNITAVAGRGIATSVVAAADNTLGTGSRFANATNVPQTSPRGRLYAAYVNRDNPQSGPPNPLDNTDIFYVTSDDGGATWGAPTRLNDDNAVLDGYSEASFRVTGDRTSLANRGRPQFLPAIAVDQSSGALAVSWYDARWDAARARVSTYLAVSRDGGATFDQNYVNPSNMATNAVTGQMVNLGPVPDNFSTTNPNADAYTSGNLFQNGPGRSMGLAAAGGRVFPVWIGNGNGDNVGTGTLKSNSLSGAVVAIGSGPRIVSATTGPINGTLSATGSIDNGASDTTQTYTFNTTTAADGHRQLSDLLVTFDSYVQASTFTASSIVMRYRGVNEPGTSVGTSVAVGTVTPIYDDRTTRLAGVARRFRVTLTTPQSALGTYSYVILPDATNNVIYSGIHNVVVTSGAAAGSTAITPSTTTQATITVNTPVGATNVVLKTKLLLSASVTVGDLSGLTLTLTSPDGRVVTVPNSTLTGTSVTNLAIDLGELFAQATPTGGWTLSVNNSTSTTRTGTITSAQLQLLVGDNDTTAANTGSKLDQDRDGFAGALPSYAIGAGQAGSYSANDVFTAPGTSNIDPVTKAALPSGTGLYDTGTLPVVVPGPFVVGVGAAGTSLSTQAPTGATVSSINVTFDRDINAGTFTNNQVLSIIGPRGDILGPQRYTSADQNVTIPDQQVPARYLESRIVISDDYRLADVNVQLGISSARLSDLRITLFAPNGKSVNLTASNTLSGSTLSNTLFNDESTTPITAGTNGYTQSSGYRSIGFGTANALSALNYSSDTANNTTVKGTWVLRVEDLTTGGSIGSLAYWSLILTPDKSSVTVTPVNSRTFAVGFPAQHLSGTYTLTLGSTITSTAGDLLDTSNDAGVDTLLGKGSGSTSVLTYPSTNIPVAIAANSTVTSTLKVNGTFNIQSIAAQLNITHSSVKDLLITLTGPGGRVLTLVSSVGLTGPTANFQNTTFTDIDPTTNVAATPISNGVAPFLGTFRPQDTATFSSQFVGQPNADTTWTLSITNRGSIGGILNSWNLQLGQQASNNGLGEAVDDQAKASFTLYNLTATSPQASTDWTAVGPASLTNADGTFSRIGRMSRITLDPSDPSGNTVYAASASGGLWRSTNFLSAAGPTWVPLTDFGPTSSLNIGAITVFPRNNDPRQTVIFAGTGEGDANTPGVGFLYSTNAGQTWQILDSTSNVDSGGTLLPLQSTSRDHVFSGAYVYKMAVDPKLTASGDIIVFAAVGGNVNQAGLWRSSDSGKSWTRVLGNTALVAPATDISLDLNSGYTDAFNNPTGNLQWMNAALAGVGVFRSVNGGLSWSLMNGGAGNALKINQAIVNPASGQIPVSTLNTNPNGAFQRITLARPALTGNPAQDRLYQGWLYAVVAQTNANGDVDLQESTPASFQGLYVTKDFGANWTQVQLNAEDQTGVPTNNNNATASAAPFNKRVGLTTLFTLGNYQQTLAVDPLNPNVVYLGGFATLRIDTTSLADTNALFLDQNANDGGQLYLNSTATVTLDANKQAISPTATVSDAHFAAGLKQYDPVTTPYINLVQNPANPFGTNTAIPIEFVSAASNSGDGAKWAALDATPLGGADGQHDLVSMVDPLTGRTRLIFATNYGIYTGVYGSDGKLYTPTGSGASAVTGSRNGNLQTSQLYYGAVDPGLATDVATAQRNYFIFSGKDIGAAYLPAGVNPFTTGSLTYTGTAGDAGGVAIAQTSSAHDYYQYFYPIAGGLGTNFFKVNGISFTSGLVQVSTSQNDLSGDPQWPDTVIENFAVNPINPNEIIIPSAEGRIFASPNKGVTWSVIAQPSQLGLTLAPRIQRIPALAYGAPDPAGQGGTVAATGQFIYAGTAKTDVANGQVYVTFNGGGTWTNISGTGAGALDGSTVHQIVTNPQRGSHEAYAVTDVGVYYMANSAAANPTWQLIGSVNSTNTASGSLAAFANAFGDPNMSFKQLTSLRTIQADWRYRIPDANGNVHPVLYVGGVGGIYRSVDNGSTWFPIPSVSTDGSSVNGGGLPNVTVSDLRLSTGQINPATGYPDTSSGEAILLASTYGRGAFAIRVAPLVISASPVEAKRIDPVQAPKDYIGNSGQLTFTGRSAATAFGNSVTVKLFDLTTGSPVLLSQVSGVKTDSLGNYTVTFSPATPALTTQKTYVLGVQASEETTGAVSAYSSINYLLDTTPPAAPTVTGITAATDGGASQTDLVTSNRTPVIFGTSEANGTILITIRDNTTGLVRQSGSTVVANSGVWSYTATTLTDGNYTIQALAVDAAGNTSTQSGTASSALVIDTVAPTAPATPALAAGQDTGVSTSDNYTSITTPVVTGTVPASTLVFVSQDGGTFTQVTNISSGSYSYQPATALTDGTHSFTARFVDIAGNTSVSSGSLTVVIDTTAPYAGSIVPKPALDSADDSGKSNNDGITRVTTAAFTGNLGNANANSRVSLIVDGTVVNTGTAAVGTGAYSIRLPAGLADGTHLVSIRVTDLAGNTSAASGTTTLVLDTAAPAITPQALSATKGQSFSSIVATYTDANPGGVNSIDFSDNTPLVSGTDALNAGTGKRELTTTHTFMRSGTFNFTVSVTDLAGNSASATGTASVTGNPVTATGNVTVTGTETIATGSVVLATFKDPTGSEPTASYTASVNWGDGSAADGNTTITYNASTDTFSVLGGHTYGEDGSYPVTVTIRTGGVNPTSTSSTAVIGNRPVLAAGTTNSTTAGVSLAGAVVTFVDPGASPSSSAFSGTIAWGDGTTDSFTSSSVVAVAGTTAGTFQVNVPHVYTEGPGTYSPVVTILNKGGVPVSVTSSVSVANGLPTGVLTGESVVFTGTAASFGLTGTDPSLGDRAAGFTYSVNWGDGSPVVSVQPGSNNGSGVTLSKVFAATGTYTASLTITDRNGGSTTSTRSITVAAAPVISAVQVNGTNAASSGVTPLAGDVSTIAFNLSTTTPGVSLPALTVANLTLVRNGLESISLAGLGSQFTFNPATGNGSINLASLDLPNGFYEFRVSVPNAPTRSVQFTRLEGDFNNDGIVNAKDYNLLKAALGRTPSQAGFVVGGDLNGNGVIDANDLLVLRSQFNQKLVNTSRTIRYDPTKPLQRLSPVTFSGRAGSGVQVQELVLTNRDATRTVDLSNINFSGATGSLGFVVVGYASDTRNITIPAGGSVRIRLFFRPQVTGKYTASVTFGIGPTGTVNPQIAVQEIRANVSR